MTVFSCIFYFFFFQAEDGIRDWSVTGVQTCALPIWTIPAAFGRDHKVLGIRSERFGDQFFADIRTIRIRGIYEVDSQLNGAAENSDCCRRILGWPPNSVARNPHGTETKTVDSEFTAK